MKTILKVRNSEDAVFQNGKITTPILPQPITNVKKLYDGSYLGQYKNSIVYFKKTLWGDYYTSLFSKYINPICYCSDKLSTAFCLVSRNANTSIVLSALHAEGAVGDDYSNDKLLWHDKDIMNYLVENNKMIHVKDLDLSKYQNFIIVLDEPTKRFVRVANKIFTDETLVHLVKDFKKEETMERFLDEIIFYADLCENDKLFLWQRHLGLQKTLYDICMNKTDKFKVVKLEDLPQWWQKTYNTKWLRNNVSKKRIVTRESFNDEQWEKVLKFLQKDIELWKSVENEN